MATPILVGRPLPRAREAYVEPVKLTWLLSPDGHGRELARVFRIGPSDADRVWTAIASAIRTVPVVSVRTTRDGTTSCRVDVILTLGVRSALVRTAWHYTDVNASPRLVTAFPTL